jgi:hypothetical protein
MHLWSLAVSFSLLHVHDPDFLFLLGYWEEVKLIGGCFVPGVDCYCSRIGSAVHDGFLLSMNNLRSNGGLD